MRVGAWYYSRQVEPFLNTKRSAEGRGASKANNSRSLSRLVQERLEWADTTRAGMAGGRGCAQKRRSSCGRRVLFVFLSGSHHNPLHVRISSFRWPLRQLTGADAMDRSTKEFSPISRTRQNWQCRDRGSSRRDPPSYSLYHLLTTATKVLVSRDLAMARADGVASQVIECAAPPKSGFFFLRVVQPDGSGSIENNLCRPS